MNWIVIWGKKLFLVILLVIILLSFGSGFFMGNKYGKVVPVLNNRLVPIYRVDRNDKKIAITLDGTWGAEYTEEILDILDEYNLKITFFFAGYWLEKYPELVKEIARRGHEIGNHTYTHPHCNDLSRSQLEKELEDTSQLIEDLTGKRPRFFRPPFGEYNNRVIETAEELGYQVIQWSLDSLDWQEPGSNYIFERILEKVSSGDIILMHNNAPDTPEALKKLIPKLNKQNYEIVPLSELVYKNNYSIQSHNGLQVKNQNRGEQYE
ncbi:MAG: polysaccharide deacetylase family protein [Bacillota bacterium]